MDRCPSCVNTGTLDDFFEGYCDLMEHHVFPVEGGRLEQSEFFLRSTKAMNFFVSKYEKKKEDDRKAKMKMKKRSK